MSTRERTRLISTDRIAGSVYVEGGTVTGLPAALGQATAAASTPVVLNTENPVGDKADAAAQSGTVSVVALLKYIAAMVKAEEEAHVNGDKGVMALGVLNQAGSTLSAVHLGYIPSSHNHRGHTYISPWISSVLADGSTVNVAPISMNDATDYILGVVPLLYNGASKDLLRNNFEAVAL